MTQTVLQLLQCAKRVAPRGQHPKQSRIIAIICRGDWKELDEYLDTEEGKKAVSELHGAESNSSAPTALHAVCEAQAPLWIVRRIVKLCPRALHLCNNDGHTPFHVAAKTGGSLPLIKYLLCKCRAVAALTDNMGRTPLILFCQNIEHLDIASLLFCTKNTVDTKMEKMVDALCEAAPSSVLVKDLSGFTALDYAKCGAAPENVFRHLAKNMQEKRKERLMRRRGLLQNSMDESAIKGAEDCKHASLSPADISFSSSHLTHLILNQDWKNLRVYVTEKEGVLDAIHLRGLQHDDGKLTSAVHLVCMMQPPLDIVEQLVSVCPFSLPQRDYAGRTPLHVALRNGASVEVMDFLIERYPSGLSVVDGDGKTPIALYCEIVSRELKEFGQTKVLQVVRTLCDKEPFAVNQTDDYGMNALEYALTCGGTMLVVNVLMKASRNSRQRCDSLAQTKGSGNLKKPASHKK